MNELPGRINSVTYGIACFHSFFDKKAWHAGGMMPSILFRPLKRAEVWGSVATSSTRKAVVSASIPYHRHVVLLRPV